LPISRNPASALTLEARIAALPCWHAKVTMEPLRGGLSNLAFVVDDGAARYVARCGDDIPIHHVFRERERAASIAAHAAGLSPELVHAEAGIMVLRHVPGKTLVEADLAANIARIVPLLKTCHRVVARRIEGPANLFWVFHVIRGYVRALRAAPAQRSADLARWVALADALEATQMPLPIVFGHHDLLPGNFIDNGERLWLIDWEYGGFGTAMFDLANLAANGSFAPAEDRRLLEAYFEEPVRDVVQRSFDAMKVASALREAMWAMVSQIHAEVPGVDYRAHAADFLARTELALAQFQDRHGRLLTRRTAKASRSAQAAVAKADQSRARTCSGSSSSSSSSSS
jgi:thiamine kinase-like enzyme